MARGDWTLLRKTLWDDKKEKHIASKFFVNFSVYSVLSILSKEAVPTKWQPCQDSIMPSTVEETEKLIENKLKVLKLMHESTETITRSTLIKPIWRQRNLLKGKVEECHEVEWKCRS